MVKLEKEQYQLVQELFSDPRFHMTKSVFQELEGEIYVNDINEISFACVFLKSFCFINGVCSKEMAFNFFNWLPKTARIINPGENWEEQTREFFIDKYECYKRYCMKKISEFSKENLLNYINKLDPKYSIKKIDIDMYNKIQEIGDKSFCTNLGMTYEYDKNGIGFVCLEQKEIVGVATSNIIYRDGIEINIKVNPDKRRQGIAKAISAKLILECINKNIYPSWDAANEKSLALAKQLGYEVDKSYNVYLIRKK